MLLWSPGSEKNVYHPGDDEKAGAIVNALGQAVLACRTSHLSELIAVLSMADIVVCGDGGAMHIAAGLGKPIVTMWGSTNQDRWRPFGIDHIILQGNSRRAEDISVEAVSAALDSLLYNRSCL
jgi:ADP-heptose:LPS heptosyltransferase